MCAIAGIIGLPADEKTLGAMLQSMHRRGPDAEGIYSAEEATLLHARLIIRDPEGGKQPMHLAWAGEKYTIVYNGELYNTEEIRKELEEAGHTFLGYSDTEVNEMKEGIHPNCPGSPPPRYKIRMVTS